MPFPRHQNAPQRQPGDNSGMLEYVKRWGDNVICNCHKADCKQSLLALAQQAEEIVLEGKRQIMRCPATLLEGLSANAIVTLKQDHNIREEKGNERSQEHIVRNLLSLALLKHPREVARLCMDIKSINDPRLEPEQRQKMAECAFQIFLSFEISQITTGKHCKLDNRRRNAMAYLELLDVLLVEYTGKDLVMDILEPRYGDRFSVVGEAMRVTVGLKSSIYYDSEGNSIDTLAEERQEMAEEAARQAEAAAARGQVRPEASSRVSSPNSKRGGKMATSKSLFAAFNLPPARYPPRHQMHSNLVTKRPLPKGLPRAAIEAEAEQPGSGQRDSSSLPAWQRKPVTPPVSSEDDDSGSELIPATVQKPGNPGRLGYLNQPGEAEESKRLEDDVFRWTDEEDAVEERSPPRQPFTWMVSAATRRPPGAFQRPRGGQHTAHTPTGRRGARSLFSSLEKSVWAKPPPAQHGGSAAPGSGCAVDALLSPDRPVPVLFVPETPPADTGSISGQELGEAACCDSIPCAEPPLEDLIRRQQQPKAVGSMFKDIFAMHTEEDAAHRGAHAEPSPLQIPTQVVPISQLTQDSERSGLDQQDEDGGAGPQGLPLSHQPRVAATRAGNKRRRLSPEPKKPQVSSLERDASALCQPGPSSEPPLADKAQADRMMSLARAAWKKGSTRQPSVIAKRTCARTDASSLLAAPPAAMLAASVDASQDTGMEAAQDALALLARNTPLQSPLNCSMALEGAELTEGVGAAPGAADGKEGGKERPRQGGEQESGASRKPVRRSCDTCFRKKKGHCGTERAISSCLRKARAGAPDATLPQMPVQAAENHAAGATEPHELAGAEAAVGKTGKTAARKHAGGEAAQPRKSAKQPVVAASSRLATAVKAPLLAGKPSTAAPWGGPPAGKKKCSAAGPAESSMPAEQALGAAEPFAPMPSARLAAKDMPPVGAGQPACGAPPLTHAELVTPDPAGGAGLPQAAVEPDPVAEAAQPVPAAGGLEPPGVAPHQQAEAMTAVFGHLALHITHALVPLLTDNNNIAAAILNLDDLVCAPDLKLRNARHARECCVCNAHLDLAAFSEDTEGKGDMFCIAHRKDGQYTHRLESKTTLRKLRFFLEQADGVPLKNVRLGKERPRCIAGHLVDGRTSLVVRDLLHSISPDLLHEAASKLDLQMGEDEDVVDALMLAAEAKLYVEFNFDPRAGAPIHPAVEVMRGLRALEDPTLAEVASEMFSADKCSTTLVILGTKGTGTPFHMDRTEARNIAYAVEDVELRGQESPAGGFDSDEPQGEEARKERPLSCWCLVSPHRSVTAILAIQDILGERYSSEVILTEEELLELVRRVGKDTRGRDYVHIIKQVPGSMVYVPAGWMHQVFNYRPCIKLAYDMYCPDNFAQYIKVWLEVMSRVRSLRQSEDYMAACGVLVHTVCRLVDDALLASAERSD